MRKGLSALCPQPRGSRSYLLPHSPALDTKAKHKAIHMQHLEQMEGRMLRPFDSSQCRPHSLLRYSLHAFLSILSNIRWFVAQGPDQRNASSSASLLFSAHRTAATQLPAIRQRIPHHSTVEQKHRLLHQHLLQQEHSGRQGGRRSASRHS